MHVELVLLQFVVMDTEIGWVMDFKKGKYIFWRRKRFNASIGNFRNQMMGSFAYNSPSCFTASHLNAGFYTPRFSTRIQLSLNALCFTFYLGIVFL